ncbi:MAG TPA: hypothetical protein VFE32_21420 [Puia sp.]|jgi:DNA-binding PadR family transcriptional regulator|nr:hypothetical protein [Puia sp.]
MDNLSLIDIDIVLRIVAKDPLARGHVSDGELAKILEKRGINPEGLISLLNKLERDKFVDTHLNDQGIKRYAASVEGREFWDRGGYAGLELQKAEAREIDEVIKRKLRIDLANAERVYRSYRTTRILAWIGAVSGLVAIVFSLLKTFFHFPAN